MATKDFYKTLGVSKSASDAEIKKAYRKLAQKFHPDNTKTGDEKKFKEAGEAYEILKDPEKRKLYDQYGADGFNQYQQGADPRQYQQWGGGPPPGGFGGFNMQYDRDNLNVEDILGSFFGRGQAHANVPQKGNDLQVSMTISLTDAFAGQERTIRVEGKTFKVKVPPGAKHGSKIRFRGAGEPGQRGGAAGDLVVVINVTADPRFERLGDDLLSTKRIDFPTAALGDSVPVETIDGKVKLKIPAGTQNDSIIRLGGKGMPTGSAKKRGDHLVRVFVVVPKSLTKKQRELLEAFRKA